MSNGRGGGKTTPCRSQLLCKIINVEKDPPSWRPSTVADLIDVADVRRTAVPLKTRDIIQVEDVGPLFHPSFER